MNCGCMNQKLGREKDRARRLAKALAEAKGETVGLYAAEDGTYRFAPLDAVGDKNIIEFFSPF